MGLLLARALLAVLGHPVGLDRLGHPRDQSALRALHKQSAQVQIEANEISLNIIKKEYEAGIRTFTDLIDQEEKLLDAYLYSLNKNKDYLINYFQIFALQGKLIEIFNDYLPKL